ncbi:MAG: nucleotide exchange factor GrpE [Anaerolineae bacterium]|nr:nucleotide exchange factor GrpE [Anaerolineae bacterium]
MKDLVQEPENNNEEQMETEEMADDTPQMEENVAEIPEITALQEQIESLQQEAQNNLDGWQRERAEFTNYKRRTTQELADSKQKGALDAISKFLPIIDDFERSINNIPDALVDDPWANGTALILKNMQKLLDQYNIEVIDPVGEEFDPNQHEAVIMEDSDEYESGTVTATLQKGYRKDNYILRPALVRVAS